MNNVHFNNLLIIKNIDMVPQDIFYLLDNI